MQNVTSTSQAVPSTSQTVNSTPLNVPAETESENISNVPVGLEHPNTLDISRKGEEKMTQDFQGHIFKKQNDGRSFQVSWLKQYPWIEYSKQLDAVFCYPCRQFGIGHASDIFCTTGYNNWKKAQNTGQGLKKHEASSNHLKSMLSWKEKQSRLNRNEQIYYCKTIISTIFFFGKKRVTISW